MTEKWNDTYWNNAFVLILERDLEFRKDSANKGQVFRIFISKLIKMMVLLLQKHSEWSAGSLIIKGQYSKL